MQEKYQNITGLRKPTEEEHKHITMYFDTYFKKRLRSYFGISIFLGVISFCFLVSYFSLGIPGFIVGIAFGLLAIHEIFVRNRCRKIHRIILSGKYGVIDGRISRIERDSTTINQDSVQFTSKDGQIIDHWFAAQSHRKVGDDLLLVYISTKQYMGGWAYVLTEDMLLSDGTNYIL